MHYSPHFMSRANSTDFIFICKINGQMGFLFLKPSLNFNIYCTIQKKPFQHSALQQHMFGRIQGWSVTYVSTQASMLLLNLYFLIQMIPLTEILWWCQVANDDLITKDFSKEIGFIIKS